MSKRISSRPAPPAPRTPGSPKILHVGEPNIANRRRFLSRVSEMLDRRWLTNDGPFVREFEQRIADRVGVKHCVATCNATVALQIAIRAAELTGEVIVPAFTFVATVHALEWHGITPVFGDMDPRTHNIDPRQVEALITPRTTGIIGVHVWGRPCDTDALEQIARERRLTLLFDAAHAFGCSRGGRMIGGFGSAEVFSFHATKFLNSFEGGAIVTGDDGLAARSRLMRNFGFAGYDNVISVGTNGKMTEICAAMGLTNLECMDDLVAVNRRNYLTYKRGLTAIPGVSLIGYDSREACNYQYIVLEIDEASCPIGRDAIVDLLHANDVLARRYFYPGCHRMAPYRSRPAAAQRPLPATDRLCADVVVLPSGTHVTASDITKVCSILRAALVV